MATVKESGHHKILLILTGPNWDWIMGECKRLQDQEGGRVAISRIANKLIEAARTNGHSHPEPSSPRRARAAK